jgi:cytochrome c-type biogenesis protein
MTLDFPIAFGVMLAGFVSFLSPCVLPLVPPYLAYLGGTSLETMTSTGSDKGPSTEASRRTVLAALCFVAGFTTVFVALGASASVLGNLIQTYKGTLSTVAGLVIILFGLHFLGLLRIPLLYQQFSIETDMRGASYAGAYLIGLAFAFGWTPCVGPVLATVLTLAANENSLKAGVTLLFLYSLGLGIPFVLAAMAVRPFLALFQQFRQHLGRVEKIMGAALVLTGILFLTGSIGWFGQWLIENVPMLARFEEWVTPKGLDAAILKKGGGG